MEPKILILTSNSYNKIYFAREISRHYKIAGVVIEQKFSVNNRLAGFLNSVNYNPAMVLYKLYHKAQLSHIDRRYNNTAVDMLLKGQRWISFPEGTSALKTNDINSPEVESFIKRCAPDIILASGPSLVKKNIITLAPRAGIINMHTGLSPYYRGGPCTFWCLYNEELEYLGVTIHHLTPGIDSGDIILSERETRIEPGDNEATLDCKVVMRGAGLMVKAVRLIFEGKAPRVPQWTKGKNYLHKYFTPAARLELERKLKSGLVKNWLSRNSHRQFKDIIEVKS